MLDWKLDGADRIPVKKVGNKVDKQACKRSGTFSWKFRVNLLGGGMD